MEKKELENQLEELKDRKIDEDDLEKISGGSESKAVAAEGSESIKGIAKKYGGGLAKKSKK